MCVVGTAVLTCVAVLVSTAPNGAIVTTDSVSYASVADGLWRFDHFSGTPVVLWPPGFPMVLAAVDGLLPGDALVAGRALNALLGGIVVLLTGVLLRRHASLPYAVVGTLTVGLAWPMLVLSTSLLSESLYMVLALGSLVAIDVANQRPDPGRLLAVAALAAGFASLTRYLGLALIFAEVVAVVLLERGRSGFRRAALFATVASVPPVAWIIRNVILSGAPFGDRGPGAGTVRESLVGTAQEISSWVVPSAAPAPVRYTALLGVVILASAGAARWRSAPLVSVVIFHVGYVMLSFTLSTTDEPNTRLLAPILPILVVLCAIGAERLLGHDSSELRRIVAIGAAAGWMAFAAYRTADTATDIRAAEHGYQTARWSSSETLHAAADLEGTIYSNAPDVIWLYTGRQARITPCASYCPWDRLSTTEDLAQADFIVWFDEQGLRPYLVSLDELRTSVDIEAERQLSDGAVYRVTASD